MTEAQGKAASHNQNEATSEADQKIDVKALANALKQYLTNEQIQQLVGLLFAK